jgi:MFS family permease
MSMRFGPKLVLGISVLISSIFTLLLPFAARFHYIALSIFRFIIGAAHGVVWPAFAGFWANWAPPAERSRLIGIANAGAQIGNVIALPLGGFLCVNGFDGGWPSIFYVFGIAGLVWSAIWFVTASDSPDDNRFIGDNEKEFILNETKETRSSHSEGESNAPWLAIMTSKAAIGIFIGHTCSNWGTYLFLTSLPSYMKEVLKFDIKSVNFIRFIFFTCLNLL